MTTTESTKAQRAGRDRITVIARGQEPRRHGHLDPADHAAIGLAARARIPLDAHADWLPVPDRPDPVTLLNAQAASRLPELVPIRYGRMLVSPFTFFRGAAVVMAADLATTPSSGLVSQLSGDAHLSNFGAFASPDRHLVFDVNDFDETLAGPWEWDLKRLVASLVVAARENGFSRKDQRRIVRAAVRSYREAMARFAAMRELEVWYARADLDHIGDQLTRHLTEVRRKRFDRAQAKARTHDSLQAMNKLTELVRGRRRIVGDPPLIVPLRDLVPGVDDDESERQLRALVGRYRRSLQVDRRVLLEQFQFVDVARKVVGVGSVGTRCWIVLLRGRDDGDPLLLQVKEAQRSVLARYVKGAGQLPRHATEGQRVVSGQRLMQAASDIFLGWATAEGLDGQQRPFYVRQLRDWKGSALVEDMDPEGMLSYGALCAWTLSRAHARTGDRIAIAAYLGDGSAFDHALVEFAEAYADTTERDYARLQEAVRTGRIAAEPGV